MSLRDRRRTRASIGLESLEGRRVLSTASAAVAPIGASLVRGVTYLDLQGATHGTPSSVVGNPDVGTTVNFRGTGTLTGFGPAKLTGSLHGTGFIASSHVEGTITLAGSKGNVTLKVQSPSAGGFTAPGSGNYTYSVLKGTGTFKHGLGSGMIALNLGSKSFTMTFQGTPNNA